jgi:hypothetical protein
MTNNNTVQQPQRLPNIPKELHSEFKAICAIKGMTMQVAAEIAIRDFIDKLNRKEF